MYGAASANGVNPDPAVAVHAIPELTQFGRVLRSGEPLGDGYVEEYPLEDPSVPPSDFVARACVSGFRRAWNGTDDGDEALGKFTMPVESLDDAVSYAIGALGMAPCDGTGRVPNEGPADRRGRHMLHPSRRFLIVHEVLAGAQPTI